MTTKITQFNEAVKLHRERYSQLIERMDRLSREREKLKQQIDRIDRLSARAEKECFRD